MPWGNFSCELVIGGLVLQGARYYAGLCVSIPINGDF